MVIKKGYIKRTFKFSSDCVGSANTINILCNCIDPIYSFIPVSGCVGRGPSALLCTGVCNDVKTTLGTVCQEATISTYWIKVMRKEMTENGRH